MIAGIRQARGPTWRRLFEGGDQERDLAASFFEQAKRFADRWPRTAAVLRELGEGYEHEARQDDERAERRRGNFDN